MHRFLLAVFSFVVVVCLPALASAQISVQGNFKRPVTFVGPLVDDSGQSTGALVAFYIGEGPVKGELEVAAYVCDGQTNGFFQYFRGAFAKTGGATLTSLSGQATLTAAVTKTALSGGTMITDGTSNTFTAGRAANGAGFYVVTFLPNGQFFGDAFRTKGRIRGTVVRTGDGADATGEIVLATGETVPFAFTLDTLGDPGEYRVIIGNDGSVVGAKAFPYIEQDNRSGDGSVRGHCSACGQP